MVAKVYKFPSKDEMPLTKWKNSIEFLYNTQSEKAASDYAKVFVPLQFWDTITTMIKEQQT